VPHPKRSFGYQGSRHHPGCVVSDADYRHQQYLSSSKNPNGYCNHGPNGLTCPVGVARVPQSELTAH